MKKRAFAMLLVLGCLIVSAHAIQAQGGGKAEPNRIQFKRGAHSATYKGKLRGDEQAEYIFSAGAGQAVSINIASVPADTISIEMQTSNGDSIELNYSGSKWTGTIPDTGDYLLYVKIAPGCTSHVSYTLTLLLN